MIEQSPQTAKSVVDGGIAAYTLTAPLWVQYIQTYGGVVMFVGGAALLILRLLIAWKEWRAK